MTYGITLSKIFMNQLAIAVTFFALLIGAIATISGCNEATEPLCDLPAPNAPDAPNDFALISKAKQAHDLAQNRYGAFLLGERYAFISLEKLLEPGSAYSIEDADRIKDTTEIAEAMDIQVDWNAIQTAAAIQLVTIETDLHFQSLLGSLEAKHGIGAASCCELQLRLLLSRFFAHQTDLMHEQVETVQTLCRRARLSVRDSTSLVQALAGDDPDTIEKLAPKLSETLNAKLREKCAMDVGAWLEIDGDKLSGLDFYIEEVN